MSAQLPQFLLIGNPENRRVQMFQEALARLQWPQAKLVSYVQILSQQGDLRPWLAAEVTHLRIESPGENFDVMRQLLAWGAAQREQAAPDCPWLEANECASLAPDHGAIRFPTQLLYGWQCLLSHWTSQLAEFPALRVMNHPLAIAAMFDKQETYHRLCGHQLPCPRRFATVRSYDALRALMHDEQCERVFVKLRGGSSASGVVAYRVQKEREMAITSAQCVSQGGQIQLYNSLRIQRYQHHTEIRALFDQLLREDTVCEEWVPKASLQGGAFDLRVVVIAKEARHTVMRISLSPMTNLHLGNRRGDVEALQAKVQEARWQQLCELSQRALEAFPQAHYAGVDIMWTPGWKRLMVLEVNAFGDLLPHVLHRDVDTYTAELLALESA